MINIIHILLEFLLMGSLQTTQNENAFFEFFNEDSILISFDEFIYETIEINDRGADVTTICKISFDVCQDSKITNIVVESNCDFCNDQVRDAVIKSAPYWHLRNPSKRGKVVHLFKYKILSHNKWKPDCA